MKPRYRPGQRPKEPRKPTRDDEAQARITEAATDAAIEALKPTLEGQPYRLVRSLERHEVMAMAVAVIAAYTQAEAAEEFRDKNFNDPIDDLFV